MEGRAVIILSISTSQMSGGAALTEDGALLGEFILASKKTHSRRLMAQIMGLLEEAELTWDDIGLIAVDQGPGSFTGLRIGISTAKGLAYAKGLSVAAVPSLDALADNCRFFSGLVLPVIDARRGEVYCALYQADGRGGIRRLSDYKALCPEDVHTLFKEQGHEERAPVMLLGDGLVPHGDRLRKALCGAGVCRLVEADARAWTIRPSAIGFIAWGLLERQGILPLSPDELLPLYCRLSEAEEKLKREGRA